MGIYVAGVEYSKIYVGGTELTSPVFGAASDTEGTLRLSRTGSGRNIRITLILNDPDGIRSITSATYAVRTIVQSISYSRTSSTTFTYGLTTSSGVGLWTFRVTYIDDTSGDSHTLSATITT